MLLKLGRRHMSTRLKAQQGQARPLWSHRRYSFVIKLAVKSLNATVLVPLLVKQTNANYYKSVMMAYRTVPPPTAAHWPAHLRLMSIAVNVWRFFINMLSAFNT